MELFSYFKHLLDYNDWANRKIIASINQQSEPKSIRLMGHIVAVEFLWLDRIKNIPNSIVWPGWDLQQISSKQAEITRQFADFLHSLTPKQLDSNVNYVNSKGTPYTNTVGDIVTHVFMHSTYHRGQIAMTLRNAGLLPPYTDFIEAVRSGRS